MQKILSTARRAITDYNMIENGDTVAVGISGGKDSMALLEALHILKKFIGIDYNIKAVTIDMRFNNTDGDFSSIQAFCDQRGIEYEIVPSDLAEIIFDIRKEKNPCSLCSRMRRGIIHNTTKALGCNKLALGHHQDDVVETFFMNLFSEGRLGCFQPVTYLSRKDITMIRPLIYTQEKDIIRAVAQKNIPVVKSACKVDKHTYREQTKNWLDSMVATVPDIRVKAFGAVSRSTLKGWNKKPVLTD